LELAQQLGNISQLQDDVLQPGYSLKEPYDRRRRASSAKDQPQ
jgi:hypothetical protein